MSGVTGSSFSKARKEDLNTGVNNHPSNSIKIDRQLNKKVSRPSHLTISVDVHKILAPEESLLLTGETSPHDLIKHSF